MYIVSKFHDYYDTASAYGIDKTCVYQRKTEEIAHYDRYVHEYEIVGKHIWKLQMFAVFFCGKTYSGARFARHDNPTITKYFYDGESALAFVDAILKNKKRPKPGAYRRYPWPSGRYMRESLQRHFEVTTVHMDFEPLSREHRSPTIIWWKASRKLEINPVLREIEFYKVKDAFTAFQDIFQYLSGVLGNKENEMVTISDEDMAVKKGYDDWSFRRHSEDSKKPRKRGK